MSRQKPQVSEHMTPSPYTIGKEQMLAQAHKLMREHRIRHLPVLSAGKLVGVLSDRDFHLVETLKDVSPETVTVEEAMTEAVYTVAPDAPLAAVAREMADRKYGCAVVESEGKVMGVFTTVDAMRVLAAALEAKPVASEPARGRRAAAR